MSVPSLTLNLTFLVAPCRLLWLVLCSGAPPSRPTSGSWPKLDVRDLVGKVPTAVHGGQWAAAAEMTVSMLFWRASRPKTKDKVEVELQAQNPDSNLLP